MQEIQMFLKHTPLWVYVVGLLLLRIGMRSMQTRVVPLRKLLISPAILILLAIHNLIIQSNLTFLFIAAWLVAIVSGGYIGWHFVRAMILRFDKIQYLVEVPGNLSTVVIMCVIFASKFYFGYEAGTNQEIVSNFDFKLLMFIVTGLCTGIICGRLVAYLYCFRQGKSVALNFER